MQYEHPARQHGADAERQKHKEQVVEARHAH
jgi:hypothetical protein